MIDRVLVTGASGFLGAATVDRLVRAGLQVTAVVRSGDSAAPDVLRGDLSDRDEASRLLRPWRWDAVLHLAGPAPKARESWHEGAATITAHVRLAANVRAAVPLAQGIRVVHASGMVVYGAPPHPLVAEDEARRPLHAYGLAKVLAEDVWLAGEGLDRWILRVPGLFGESRRSGALYAFARAAAERRELRITVEEPTPWDVLHVEDAAEAMLRVLRAEAVDPGPVNIGYGVPIDLESVARAFAARTGAAVVNTTGVRNPPFALDPTRARRLLDWEPPTLEARLQRFWETVT